MSVFNRFRPGFRRESTGLNEQSTTVKDVDSAEKTPGTNTEPDFAEGAEAHLNDRPNEDAQRGVRMVEAVTLTWSKRSLIAIFINMWFLYFVNAFQSSILNNLTPYVTSDFESHSLLTVIYIVSSCMSAACYIPISKILDLWGRAEGFVIMVGFATLGLILMASCHSLGTFCAAQVFYSIGFGGMTYSVDVITADATKLKNRGLAFAFTSSPYMITAFAGPKASEGFYDNISWRWGFGAFSIILPFVAAPLFSILKVNLRRAEKEGILVRRRTDRTIWQSILHYIIELDAPGVFLFAAGLVIFLLPFSLADSAPNGWNTGYIIAMIVVGIVLLVIFGLYEAYVARQPMLSFKILTNRTVIGACLLCFSYQVSYYCWASYFTSFLQVVNGLSISTAGYVSSTFDVVSGVCLLSVGFIIRKTGYFRWLLFIAVPLYVFAQGLMIYFRRPNRNIGYLVMCQIFLSIGGSVIILCEQLAVLAAGDHQYVAALLALLYVVGNIGGAVGNSISGAIWTNTFGQALERYLPEDAQSSLEDIYSSLEVQLSYEWDSPERIGIQNAYAYAQRRMLIAGTAIMALCFVWVFLIKNLNLAKIHQTRGNVF